MQFIITALLVRRLLLLLTFSSFVVESMITEWNIGNQKYCAIRERELEAEHLTYDKLDM